MVKASTLQRLRDLHPRQRLLLAEAFVVLAATSAAIKFLPFRRVVAAAAREPSLRISPGWQEPEVIRQVRWAVDRIATLVPWRSVCFQKGLAAHVLLRRRGVKSLLHYGVRRAPDGEMGAHVWVTVEGMAVVGGKEAPEFTCLATYPAAD